MGKIADLHSAEQGSTPCGVTKAAVRQDRYEDGKARHSRSGVVQSVGRCPVKAAIWVRIPVPEPWWRSSAGQNAGPSSQRSRVRIPPSPLHYHAPVVKRRSCRITDPAVGVRVPPGALHARLAQWESARFTPARRTGSIPSPSTVAVAQAGRAPGCDPGGCAFEPRRSPHARVAQLGSAASCKAVGRPATGGSSPSPGTHVPRPPPPAAACPRGAAGKRGCFRNSRSPVRVGPGIL
jgi:hypothetical protein